MLVDGRSISPSTELTADLCIIGAGPAGVTLAHELIDSGIDVVLVESGDVVASKEADALSDGADTGDKYASLSMYRRRILGGASVIWGGRCIPYDAIDFEKRDFVPNSGWPIGHAELAAYHKRAADYCEIGEPEFDTRQALGDGSALIEGFSSPRVLTTSFERFSPPTNFGRTWGPALKRAGNVRVVTNATCTELAGAAGESRIGVARFATLADTRFSIRAKRYVVACGGIETYRLLAASRGMHQSGLGNSGGALGRYFMSHAEGLAGDLTLKDPRTPIDWGFPRSRDGIYGRRRITVAEDVQRRLGLMNFVMRVHHASPADPRHGHAVLSAMFLAKAFILPEYRRKIGMVERTTAANMQKGAAFWTAHFANILRGAPSLAAFMADWTVRRYLVYRRIPYVALPSRHGVYPMEFYSEQEPDPANRVFLTGAMDRFGIPLAGVHWALTDRDVASMAANIRLVRDELEESGLATLAFDDASLEARLRENAIPVGGHFLGVARMSADAATGVVDGNLRIHDVENAYVLGGAVLPTASQANPTFEIVSLAVRLADHLKSANRL
jgi:choline dehydrogenase-like flavoprotein